MQCRRAVSIAIASLLLMVGGMPVSVAQNFGSVSIGQTATATVTVTISTAGTLGDIAVVTQGAPNLDFANAGGGTCTVGQIYAAKATCTVQVAFKPNYAFVRYGAVQLTDSSPSQNVMATVFLQGSGQGPQLIYPLGYAPPVPVLLCGAGSEPESIAIDGRGRAFVSAYLNIFEYPSFFGADCNTSSFLTKISAFGLAIDGSGALYISTGNVIQKETLLPNGSYAASTVASGLGYVIGIAVDGAGNVYGADFGSNSSVPAVIKETLQPNGTYVQSTIGSGWSAPSGVAVDSAGNVYVSDYGTGAAYKESLSSGSYTQSTVGTGFNYLDNIAVDGGGNVYLVDADPDFMQIDGSGIHEESPQPDGSYVETVLPIAYNGSSLTSVVFDGAGNQYITDQYNDGAYKLSLSEPPSPLTFTSQVQGQKVVYGANGLTLQNSGNAPMTISSIVFPKDFPPYSEPSGYCTPGTVLAPSASCTIWIGFAPVAPLVPPATSLVLNEPLQYTTNSLNAATTVTVPLTGTEIEANALSPVFSVPSGNYTAPFSVTITDATPGATIYYNIGTTVPTTSSPKYTGPITVSKTETIVAIAAAPGFLNSIHGVANYYLDVPTAAPVFSLAAGSYNAVQTITITDATPGAVIYYTLNGTTPTSGSTKYASPIQLKGSATLNAIAVAPGFEPSIAASAAYTLVASAPVITPSGGSFSGPQTVSIASPTPTALIFYTTNGSTPSASSTRYTSPLAVNASETIRAIAAETGFTASPVSSASFVIEAPATTPVIEPASGTYPALQTITITDSTPGAAIYYTTDGTMPTTASMKYSVGFTSASPETVRAIAVASGYSPSATASASYMSVGSPSALAAPATAIDTPDATLHALVNTLGLAGSYNFLYGTSSSALTSATAKTTLAASAAPVAASAQLTGLKGKTTYYFQVVVTTAAGTGAGEILSFTTN